MGGGGGEGGAEGAVRGGWGGEGVDNRAEPYCFKAPWDQLIVGGDRELCSIFTI